ncbi:Dehydratase family protein [Actinopolyspora saharensis]|uniref:Dehydratase family protein n=1 Tax=Actinopolyspora saharensis TaxID=995062 RepID=A0A1H1D915_9ACTN|nr:Dehydratase family protein [Actinopolyspora saharensis]
MHLAQRWYGDDDSAVLPRSIADKRAFENALALDVAMGDSTNTVLRTLAAAREGKIDFTLAERRAKTESSEPPGDRAPGTGR